jgi:hypothetical protein
MRRDLDREGQRSFREGVTVRIRILIEKQRTTAERGCDKKTMTTAGVEPAIS